MAWCMLGFACVALGTQEPESASRILCVASVLLGVRGFLTRGKNLIVPSGTYMLSFAVFVGLAGLIGIHSPLWGYNNFLGLSIILAYFSHVLLYFAIWARTIETPPATRITHETPRGARDTAAIVGLGLSAAGIASNGTDILGPVPDALAFAGATIVASAVLTTAPRAITAVRLSIVLLTCAIYYFTIFDGYGRLRLAALGMAVLYFLTIRKANANFKLLILVVLAVTAVALSDRRGFDSAISPLYTFAGLLELGQTGQLGLARGSTFLAAAFALIPRALWESKPTGFGVELAELFHPEYVTYGHTDVALFMGEWYFNFGFVGLIAMLPLVGITVKKLDAFVTRSATKEVHRAREFVSAAVPAIVIAGMMDLFWVGTFTFVARSGSRLIIVWVIYFVMRAVESGASSTSNRSRTVPLRTHQLPPSAGS